MRREDFFTGEVLSGTSPQISEISTEEAINNASFGKYDYEPGARLMQPISINPGGYGYNTPNPYFMNPPQYNGYYQPNMGYGYNGGFNPYYNNYYNAQYQQQQYYQQQMQQEVRTFIKPVNLSGSEYLPPMNYEDKIEQLKIDYWTKEQEEIGRKSVNNNGLYSGYNYYGAPFYNPYQYNSFNSEISNKIQEMQEKAKENRLNLNIQLATLAHNYLGDKYNEDELKERYTGKYVSNPGTPITYAEVYEQQRFGNMVPFDNAQFYRDQSAAASREYNEIIPSDSNMKDCFANMGVLNAHYMMEEEKHRRRNGTTLYNSDDNSYKYFVRAKASERYAKENGLSSVSNRFNFNNATQTALNQFPTLSQSAKLCDDGTLNITCNFGSKAGQVYSVHNSQEAGYEQDRERFQQFIDSIPGSIYLDSPNPTT